jgi:hypothetical protein
MEADDGDSPRTEEEVVLPRGVQDAAAHALLRAIPASLLPEHQFTVDVACEAAAALYSTLVAAALAQREADQFAADEAANGVAALSADAFGDAPAHDAAAEEAPA